MEEKNMSKLSKNELLTRDEKQAAKRKVDSTQTLPKKLNSIADLNTFDKKSKIRNSMTIAPNSKQQKELQSKLHNQTNYNTKPNLNEINEEG